MPENIAKHFDFTNLTFPVPVTFTKTWDKMSLNGLGVAKSESWNVYIILKVEMAVAEDYKVFNYGTPRQQKGMKIEDISIV